MSALMDAMWSGKLLSLRRGRRQNGGAGAVIARWTPLILFIVMGNNFGDSGEAEWAVCASMGGFADPSTYGTGKCDFRSLVTRPWSNCVLASTALRPRIRPDGSPGPKKNTASLSTQLSVEPTTSTRLVLRFDHGHILKRSSFVAISYISQAVGLDPHDRPPRYEDETASLLVLSGQSAGLRTALRG